jgi:CRP/FNR family cyclic AMP-dependent transcriptional regulator
LRSRPTAPFDVKTFLATSGQDHSIKKFARDDIIFSQGDQADDIFYIKVVSSRGKEAVVGIFSAGQFFGEGALNGQRVRMSTAISMGNDCTIARLSRSLMLFTLNEEPAFSRFFIEHLLSRNLRVEEDLVDQLFNSSEKRLARILLLLANFGKEGKPEIVIPDITQATLAEMIGTTRSRVSFFLNKFRRLGFIEYNGKMQVHSSLLNVVLHD